MDRDELKLKIETVGVVLNPKVEGRKGLAARAAMRTYARMIHCVDPEEADIYFGLAQHYDELVESKPK